MKKMVCLLLTFAMVFALVACGGSNTGNSTADNGGNATQTEGNTKNSSTGDETNNENKELPKVALMSMRQMTQPADESTLEGVARLKEELGLDVNIVVCTEVSEYYD